MPCCNLLPCNPIASLRARKQRKEQSQLEELQQKYEVVKSRRDWLERDNGQLIYNIKDLEAQIQMKNATISQQSSYLRDVEHHALPLEEKLSSGDRQRIHSLDRPVIGVLDACLLHLERVEREKNDKITSLTQSHNEEIDRLRTGLQFKINELEIDHLVTPDNFRPIPDKELLDRFTLLKKLIDQIARCRLERDPTTLEEPWKRSDFFDIAPANHHMFFIQSVVWDILADGIFSTPFRVFGLSGGRLFDTWQNLFGKQSNMRMPDSGWVRPDKASENWRSTTFETLQHQLQPGNVGGFTDEETKKNFYSNFSQVENTILSFFGMISSEDKSRDIRDIVDRATKFAFELGSQRCRLEFFMPHTSQEINRDKGLYKDMNNENVELASGIIKLVVAPGIRRTGDGRGYSYHETVNICPASVYLKPSY